MAFLGTFFELESNAVQAITQPCRGRSVIENVAEMSSAAGAENFFTFHPKAVIRRRYDVSRNERPGETGPACSRFELSIAREERRAAADTMENAATMLQQENGGAGSFGYFAAQDCKLRRSQLFLPVGVRFHNSRDGREIFWRWRKRDGIRGGGSGLLRMGLINQQ